LLHFSKGAAALSFPVYPISNSIGRKQQFHTHKNDIMKSLLVASLGLALTPLAFSQTNTLPPAPHATSGKETFDDKKTIIEPATPKDPRFWMDLDGQLWWVKSAPIATPTLTTFSHGSTSAKTGFGGNLGVPGTTVLSPHHLRYDTFFGGSADIGSWLDSRQRIGLEISGLLLEDKTTGFSSFSNGARPLRVPFENVPPGAGFPIGPSSFVLADPSFATGGQSITSSLHLWQIEGDALYHVTNSNRFDFSLLGGFRYLNLKENLTIVSEEAVSSFGNYRATDIFATSNQFCAGQLGAKVQTHLGRFDASLIAKFALGDNIETVTTNGSGAVTNSGKTGTTPGGIFTQRTNIGEQSHDRFCVLPEVQVQLGYNLTSRIRFYVGYDFFYMDDVARPGDQIDRTLNLTGNSLISGGSASLTGAARPRPTLNTTSFWAQGVTVGAEFKF
jgi:hypothetical protein